MATRGRKLPWISIHALRKESDMTILQHEIAGLFQSTLSVRRATSFDFQAKGVKNISIHALRKESDAGGPHGRVGHEISIHALRKESDCGPCPCR